MTERDYMKKFAKVLNSVPGCVCRIMPDTGGKTHKKPYDAFIIYKGLHFSIEGKVGDGKLEDHQKNALQEDIDAGAKSFVVRFSTRIITVTLYSEDTPHAYAMPRDFEAVEFLDWMVRV